jgi:cytochrome c oxidase assembly protein subunit 15
MTFPLIWMGGLVTTYGAGMAVPDWPNTYGYNLFLYPLESWLAVWDVFLEHSHRLIGASVGLVTIALAVLLWRTDARRWMRWLGVAALVGVVVQGTLGGLRVIGDELLLAKIHGCTAPLFFTLAAAIVTFTSPQWQSRLNPQPVRRLAWLGVGFAVLVYLQIVLGAQLRHISPSAPLYWFVLWTWLHVIVAFLVVAGSTWLLLATRKYASDVSLLRRRAWIVAGLVSLQFLLGLATWVVNYSIPAWFTDYVWPLEYTVVAEGPLQAVVTTAHVGVGSLALAAGVSLTLWSYRLLQKFN